MALRLSVTRRNNAASARRALEVSQPKQVMDEASEAAQSPATARDSAIAHTVVSRRRPSAQTGHGLAFIGFGPAELNDVTVHTVTSPPQRLAAFFILLSLLIGCSGGSTSDGTPTNTADAQTSPGAPVTAETAPIATAPIAVVDEQLPLPAGPATTSDAVPSTQELLDIGLTEEQAACFINTIDPDNTGRVANAELFAEALGCM